MRPELVVRVDDEELWRLGDSTFILPVVEDDVPPIVAFAIGLHRGALIDGRCISCERRRLKSKAGIVAVAHPATCLGNKALIDEWLEILHVYVSALGEAQ